MNKEYLTWDLEPIKHLLFEEEIKAIKLIRIPLHEHEDKIIWPKNRDGLLSNLTIM